MRGGLRTVWFWVSHAVPRVHWTTYTENGDRRLAVWRQWGTRTWAVTTVSVAGIVD